MGTARVTAEELRKIKMAACVYFGNERFARDTPTIVRLFGCVNVTPSGCWEYTRGKTGKGYGALRGGDGGKPIEAHRLSWQLTRGDIGGLCVLHKCDNRPCINPDHLFLGTKADNNKDRDAKGRDRQLFGADNSASKLTETIVRQLRKRCARGEKYLTLGREFGVRHQAISRAVRGVTWSHVK